MNFVYKYLASALQMTFERSVLHKRCVQEIIVTAAAEKRGPMLGVLYDEIARSPCMCSSGSHAAICVLVKHRKDWEDKSAKLGKNFDVNTHAGKLSEETPRRARALYDLMFVGNGFTQRPKSPVRAESTASTGVDTRVMSYATGKPPAKGHGKHQV